LSIVNCQFLLTFVAKYDIAE
jgi:hypothetical protein